MWANGRTISQKLYAGLGALLVLTMMEGAVALWGSSRIKADVATVTQRSNELQRALTIHTSLVKMESSVKGLLWAALDNDRAQYDASKKTSLEEYDRATRQVDEFRALLTDKDDQAVAEVLRQRLGEWKAVHAQIVEMSDARRIADALQLVTTKANPLFNAAEASARSFADLMSRASDGATRSLESSRSRTLTAIVIALALTVGVLVVWLVQAINASLRSMSRELGEGGQQVVEASSQMAAAAQSMSQGASEQAASLEETSASMEEIAAMTRTNADNSQQAASLMGEAARVLEQSNKSLADMVTAMTSIKDSSNRVSKIIKTIDEIAFQTNILALNAAVEAARAGDAGMGFAVVADEVRSLAQRSAQAARDTTALIEGAIASSSEGSRKVEQAAESFAAITERVTEVKRLVDSVSVASGQQAHGIEQVVHTIRQMERVTQTTAATAEESAAASEQLNTQAGVTMGLVERLEAMVDGTRSQPARPDPLRPGVTRVPLPVQSSRRTADTAEGVAFAASGTYSKF